MIQPETLMREFLIAFSRNVNWEEKRSSENGDLREAQMQNVVQD